MQNTIVKSVRAHPDDWAEMRRRAKQVGVSLNRYMVQACAGPRQPDMFDPPVVVARGPLRFCAPDSDVGMA